MKAPKLKLFLGLRGRFVVLIAGGIIFSAATVGFYLTQKIGSVYLEGLTTRAVQTARNLANHAEIATLVEDEEEIARLVNGVLVDTQIVFARVYSDDGVLLYHAGEWISYLDNSTDSGGAISKHSPSSISIRIEDHVHGGHEIISIFAPVKTWQSNIDRERLGAVYSGSTKLDKGEWIIIGKVVIGVNKEGVNDVIRRARLTAGLLTLFVIVLAIAVTVLFVKVIIKPIKRLVMVTNEISRGNLERKLDFRRNDEIGALAESFDRMVDSLQLYKSEVEEYQETLQQKIIERTSDLAEAQEQLLQSEKMKAIGQLAAGVAHELNNPLAGILGYSQFALEKLRGKNPNNLSFDEIESFRRYLGDIEAQARRCKRIVQGLLKFSRSSRTIGSTEFDLNTVLKETVELLESQIEMQQLRLSVTYDKSIPPMKGHPSRIQQVFTNIIINAMQATPNGGSITIFTKHLPKLGEFEGVAEVSIEDTGEGVPPEAMKKIFEPFFTTKDVGKGTGLGLSMSYGIIKDHGGEINVISTVGQGAKFVIILPLQKTSLNADIKKR